MHCGGNLVNDAKQLETNKERMYKISRQLEAARNQAFKPRRGMDLCNPLKDSYTT